MTKTTINYAEKRKCFVEVFELENVNLLWIGEAGYDEPDVAYFANNDGTFTYKGALNTDLEDMPGTIWNEKQLRAVVNYVSENLM